MSDVFSTCVWRFAPALAFVAAVCLLCRAQPPEPKKSADGKSAPAGLPVVKLADGTYLWTGAPADGSERVTLTFQELQKYQDQIDQLKKQVAAHKPAAPAPVPFTARSRSRASNSSPF